MQVKLYQNKSDKNKLNKDLFLLEGGEVDATLKDDTQLENPTLILNNSPAITNCDYVYIGNPCKRYYYVTGRTLSQQRIYLELHVDVLYSFREEISRLEVIADRSSSNFNLYQIDGKLPIDNFHDVTVKEFANGFTAEEWILVTTGKVG